MFDKSLQLNNNLGLPHCHLHDGLGYQSQSISYDPHVSSTASPVSALALALALDSDY